MLSSKPVILQDITATDLTNNDKIPSERDSRILNDWYTDIMENLDDWKFDNSLTAELDSTLEMEDGGFGLSSLDELVDILGLKHRVVLEDPGRAPPEGPLWQDTFGTEDMWPI